MKCAASYRLPFPILAPHHIVGSRLYPGKVTLPRSMFTELPFAVAVSKGQRQQFLTRLNAGISAIRADGTWQNINDRRTSE